MFKSVDRLQIAETYIRVVQQDIWGFSIEKDYGKPPAFQRIFNTNDDNNKSNVETNVNSGSTGPMRRKSKNNKVPIKVEINSQMTYDIINGYNMQSRQFSDSSSSNNNYASSTPTPTTATPTTASAILPSPLLASQYTDVHNHHQQQQEFVPSQNASTHTTPLTPITPPRQQAIISASTTA
ncbi:12662_t:CDS:2 [Entrophospora sp. SA101]|nr:12662_t:CDS:2 [Entrophospora sp. SA101]